MRHLSLMWPTASTRTSGNWEPSAWSLQGSIYLYIYDPRDEAQEARLASDPGTCRTGLNRRFEDDDSWVRLWTGSGEPAMPSTIDKRRGLMVLTLSESLSQWGVLGMRGVAVVGVGTKWGGRFSSPTAASRALASIAALRVWADTRRAGCALSPGKDF